MSEFSVTTFLSSGALASAIVFLAKTWITERLRLAIKDEYDQKLATLTAQLKLANDSEVENLKSRLQVLAAEQNVRFSRIFDKQSESISVVFERFSVFDTVARNLLRAIKEEDKEATDKLFESAADTFFAFGEYYDQRRIFFPRKTEAKIKSLRESYRKVMADLYQKLLAQDAEPTPEEKALALAEFEAFLDTEALKLEEALNDDFKAQFGIKD